MRLDEVGWRRNEYHQTDDASFDTMQANGIYRSCLPVSVSRVPATDIFIVRKGFEPQRLTRLEFACWFADKVQCAEFY